LCSPRSALLQPQTKIILPFHDRRKFQCGNAPYFKWELLRSAIGDYRRRLYSAIPEWQTKIVFALINPARSFNTLSLFCIMQDLLLAFDF
jgi:hypothetical protein